MLDPLDCPSYCVIPVIADIIDDTSDVCLLMMSTVLCLSMVGTLPIIPPLLIFTDYLLLLT